jgi:DNA-binding response OmpR family regulator
MTGELRIILVVEDDAPLRAMYRTALRMAGFYVNEASNGLEALRALDADPPDLVVLDLGLPIVSGYAVRTELAAQSHLRQIPVVVVTGNEPDAPLDVSCLLRKPVTGDDLVVAVNKCLAEGKSAAHGVS